MEFGHLDGVPQLHLGDENDHQPSPGMILQAINPSELSICSYYPLLLRQTYTSEN